MAEHLRSADGVGGSVTERDSGQFEASITFTAPGYAADAFIDVKAGTYDVTIQSQGFPAVMNDLHKGRDTNSSWNWVIDVSGCFLAFVALSGLLLQLFLRKRRRSSLVLVACGAALTVVLIFTTVA